MNKIKNVLFGAVAMVVAFAPLSALALALNDGVTNANTTAGYSGLANTSISTLMTNLMNWLLGIVGFLAVIGFVISGILYLTAAGDDDQITKAKSAMMYSIIGVIVALLGFVVLTAAKTFFVGDSNTF
ncbi:MAG: hypothetical protein KBB77_02915 [Candidatus Moranbacteria bacterium]|nr:hypothetical protein [Candidatus Moranbacteria bacterium]